MRVDNGRPTGGMARVPESGLTLEWYDELHHRAGYSLP